MTDQERYQRYLCSREWCEKRELVIERSRGLCERCRINSGDHIHHLTYARKYAEALEDLQHVCAECHGFIHCKSDFDPAKLPDPYKCKEIVVAESIASAVALRRLNPHSYRWQEQLDLHRLAPRCVADVHGRIWAVRSPIPVVLLFDTVEAVCNVGKRLFSEGFDNMSYVRPPAAYATWDKLLAAKGPEITKMYIDRFKKVFTGMTALELSAYGTFHCTIFE